jgi:hypothetical protein
VVTVYACYKETFPVENIDLETKFKVDFLLEQIAKRPYPPVFVVGEATEAGVPVLDGLAVVVNLRGEMDPYSERVLRDEVRRISAARQGLVIVDDDDLDRVKDVAGRTGEAPLTAKTVPIEELLQKDVDQWWFFERLEDFTNSNPEDFTIPLTERVQAFIEEHVRH